MTRLVIVGGSDAGISAALRARELDAGCEVVVVLEDRYPNFSICGIPYYISGDVPDWRNLAHRSISALEEIGMTLRFDTIANAVDVDQHELSVRDNSGREEALGYDKLVIGTGALPIRPQVDGLVGAEPLGPDDGVHLLHSMDDTFAIARTLEQRKPATVLIVGAGYIGLEMAEALAARGLNITQIEQLPEVLPTVDPELGEILRTELFAHGVEVLTDTRVTRIEREGAHLRAEAWNGDRPLQRSFDMVLVVAGVRPNSELAASAGAELGVKGAIRVDRQMRTNLRDVFAGDCVVTHHRLLGETYVPLGTTAHKQGRIAGENALGNDRAFAGSLGTQVVKVFEQVAARTGLRDHEAAAAGHESITVGSTADDHKAYYPGSHRIDMRVTGDRNDRRLLGFQMVGHRDAEIAKRIDIAAVAIHHEMTIEDMSDLDLSYTPPLGSPWDAVQAGTQAWSRHAFA